MTKLKCLHNVLDYRGEGDAYKETFIIIHFNFIPNKLSVAVCGNFDGPNLRARLTVAARHHGIYFNPFWAHIDALK